MIDVEHFCSRFNEYLSWPARSNLLKFGNQSIEATLVRSFRGVDQVVYGRRWRNK
jgi:hypothetical protein